MSQQTHDIAISLNRKRVFWALSIIMLGFVCMIGIDVFTIWAFWNHYEIDTGAYVAAFILPLATGVVGWICCLALYSLCWRDPIMYVNTRGLVLLFPIRFAFLPRLKEHFVPWEEIERIASCKAGIYTWFTISLKDPARYWLRYGQGKYRPWRRDALTGAHINIAQYSLSLSAKQIVAHIEEQYRSELRTHEVKTRS